MENIQVTLPTLTQLNPVEFGINLTFCVVASFVLARVYVRKSISLSGKFHIGTVIPLLACITFLVIMVVKSSLALSLGLVGALSVIRFRTPIKEPEELVYLFLAIALGLGYGAGQALVTTVVFLVMIGMITFWLSRKTTTMENEYNLFVEWKDSNIDAKSMIEKIASNTSMLEMQKFNVGKEERALFLKIYVEDIDSLQGILDSISELAPDSSCSFYEARALQ